VRADRLADLAAGIAAAPGATVQNDGEDALLVGGLAAERIGELALSLGVALHELAPRQSSLEDRFFELMGEEEPHA
jgi:ABC-2 type transport system ATP-binding protein